MLLAANSSVEDTKPNKLPTIVEAKKSENDLKNQSNDSNGESDSGCEEQYNMNYRTKKIAFVRKMKAMSLVDSSTDDLSDSSCNERDKAGDNSDSGNSTQNSVSSTESVLSLHPDDIEFDEKCTNLLAKNIMKSTNGQSILAVKEFARQKLIESVNGTKVKVGVIGEIGSGKSTLIKEIFGGGFLDEPTSDNRKSISYKYPKHKNITFTEIPSVTSTRRTDREDYMTKMKIGSFDLILLLTDTHIREWSMWLGRQLGEHDVPFFYVRTKIDKTTAEDAAKFPRTYCEERVVQRIRERCREAMTTGKVGSGTKAFAVSAVNKDKWDFRALLQALGEELPRNKRRSLNLCLPPLTPHIINEKQKAHAQRIWMISALSVASGKNAQLCTQIVRGFFCSRT
jgi:predicted GTPase